MSKVRIGLNPKVRDNYAFYCPISRLHLTRSNPVDFVDGITSYILRGLKSKTLLDVDDVIDLETGKLKSEKANKEKAPEDKEVQAKKEIATEIMPEQKESIKSEVQEAPVKKKNSKKAVAKAEDVNE